MQTIFQNPIAKGVYSGVGGVIGGSAGAFSQLGKTPTRIALGLVGGAALGGALGYGVNRGDNRTHQARIALMKDKNKEWLVFGKGKSHLDNE